jgi:hypothetical protein
MMVFPDLFFRRPLASLSTATMRDFSIAISCSLGRRVANGALEGPRMTIPRNGGIRKAERAMRRRRNDRLFCFQPENERIFCGAWTEITNS